ncbi:sigma-54-dependent Fis family transcriptional regulator [Melittangium boletus DSM 14713]|uniref:Sigma-54-dependent Fis family transcriptional regulator n=1 Tax=Melittangium boletus DSM 14713 TaxID=1294270 RepID=A0A250IGY7_9BACT|nr:helix-turn-helix domain-containing protein [Melittangium boletus]ATB31094.1 sigma-54-dependent Fis family transcriptional regulator [Melittangium boletus DSM 14713]
MRELRNIIERALVMESGPELELDVLQGGKPMPSLMLAGPPRALKDVERLYTRWVLERLGGRRMEAAKVLGLSYPTFLKRLGEGS